MGWSIGDQIALAGFLLMAVVAGLSLLRKPTIISAARGSEMLETISSLRAENAGLRADNADLRAQTDRLNTLLIQARDENRYLERRLRTFEDRPIRPTSDDD